MAFLDRTQLLIAALAASALLAPLPAFGGAGDPTGHWNPTEDQEIDPATENPGWTCSVHDRLQEDSRIPLVVTLAKEGSRELEITLRNRYTLRFSIGRSGSEGLPSATSGDFVTLRVSDSRTPSAPVRTSVQDVHVMNPCDASAGTFREVVEEPGFEIQCVPDRGFQAYFGDMKTECNAYVDPLVRRYEVVQRGIAEFDRTDASHAISADSDENVLNVRTAVSALETGAPAPRQPARAATAAQSGN